MVRILIEIVNEAPPAELARQIQALTPLSEGQALALAEVIVTHGELMADAKAIEANGWGVGIPSECRNCGWQGPSLFFTWRYCDDCAAAFLKGAASAIGGALGLALLGLLKIIL